MSREAMLARIRDATARNAPEDARRRTVEARLRTAPRGLIPARGQGDAAMRRALFIRMAEAAEASVAQVESAADVPAAVADHLRAANMDQRIIRGDDARLEAMPWNAQPQLETLRGLADGSELASLSHAAAGVAETGTLVLTSGPANPTRLNFLPELHVVALAAADLVGDYESAFDRIRRTYGRGAMPRTVNFVTGPSRSADIEQTLLLGAHGPRRLHIVLIG